jgi:hypothetical protein
MYFNNIEELGNKLFCTFTTKEELQKTINFIQENYNILFGKIFVLDISDTNELICTYNIDSVNINKENIINNTILMHRRKEYNVLYTINSLNKLIESLNGGVLDRNYPISWGNYRNSILLTKEGDFCKYTTKINTIINLNNI